MPRESKEEKALREALEREANKVKPDMTKGSQAIRQKIEAKKQPPKGSGGKAGGKK